jgi:hypothetical protein
LKPEKSFAIIRFDKNMLVNFKRNFLFLFCLTFAFSVFTAFLKVPAQEKTPYNILLSPSPIEKNPALKKVLSVDQPLLERAKIEYLLARIKQSPYHFIRNGRSYGGTRAAMHLNWKYKKRLDRIKTVEEFIEKIASRSWETGEAYLIKYANGKLYPIEEIFNNELRLLDEYLRSSGKSSEA